MGPNRIIPWASTQRQAALISVGLLLPSEPVSFLCEPGRTYLIPAEKLTTGKKRPSRLKFSNMPWTGKPLMRKEILGTLKSRQQLTTSSAPRTCCPGEATGRATRPAAEERRSEGF